MKVKKTLIISFKTLKQLKAETLHALKTKTPHIQPANTVFFDSLPSFREFMTVQKLEILAVISELRPQSVYELAKLLERDTAAVQRDCNALMHAGFITLPPGPGPRGPKVPKLKFPYHRLLVELPRLSYELSFKKAA